MAIVYGAKKGGYWQSYLSYSITTTSTQVKVTCTMGLYTYANKWIKSGTRKATLSATGGATYTASKSNVKESGGTHYAYISSKVYTYTRGVDDATKTISAKIVYSGSDHDGTSTATLNVNIPKLDSKKAITFDPNADVYVQCFYNADENVCVPEWSEDIEFYLANHTRAYPTQAQYEASPTTYYTVTSDATGEMPTQMVVQNVSTALSANQYMRSDWTFVGWATSPTGPVVYNNGANITTSADVTLYAVWTTKWHMPTIQGLLAYRTNSGSTTPYAEGEYGYCQFSYSGGQFITSLTATVSFSGTSTSMSVHSKVFSATSSNTLSLNNQHSVVITLTAVDRSGVSHTATQSTYISKVDVAINVSADGTSIGFGRRADNNNSGRYDFSGDISADSLTLNGIEVDYIVEQGVSNGWTYEKRASGIARCWGRKAITDKTDVSEGGGYRTPPVSMGNYPFSFIEPPAVNVTIDSSSVIMSPSSYSRGTISNPGKYVGYRNTSNTSTAEKIFNFMAEGVWK